MKNIKRILPVLLLCGLPAYADGPFVEPDVETIHTLLGEQPGDGFGWAAERLADLDGDGVAEYVVSAPFYVVAGTPAGKAYIYSGSLGTVIHEIHGEEWDELGFGVSDAGDVDADGVSDYIIGARGSLNAPNRFKGRTLIYSGADHGLIHELTIDGISGFGYDVAAAGDLDGDGYGDVIVGAPFVTGTFFRQGRVYAYSGADGSVLWFHDGAAVDDFLGSAVGSVDDLDGDGVREVVVGAMGAGQAQGRTTNGAAYVYSGATGETLFTLNPFASGTAERFGQFFASGAGDVNHDGTPDIFVADYTDRRGGGIGGRPALIGTGRAYVFSGVDGSYLHVINGENRGDGFGPGRGVGDINGDEHDDLLIAAYSASGPAPFGGKAYLISGLDASILRVMTGAVAGVSIGVDAIGLGDVNDDGLQDFLLTGFGSAYVVAGTDLTGE